MSKTIAVTGATGTQGGSVVSALLDSKQWNVRAITRNPHGESAKALAAKGVEVVCANFDDDASLIKAFEGAHAIFAVTNFWEHLFTGKTQAESGEAEERQGKLLARAAAQTQSLEHFIFSSLPPANELTGGNCPVPHLEYKARVDEYIGKEFPDLAGKTTFLYFGYYLSNMVHLPMLKPFEMPSSGGKFIWLSPTKATALIPVSGDMTITPGIWVRQILAHPEKSLGKYASVTSEVATFEQILQSWSKVTGKPAVFVECSVEHYGDIWGVGGIEFAQQLKFGEQVPDWTAHLGDRFVRKEDIGITSQEIGGIDEALKKLRAYMP